MSDLAAIRIPVDTSDIPKAIQIVNRLQTELVSFEKAVRAGTLTVFSQNAALSKSAKQLQSLGYSYGEARGMVHNFNKSLKTLDDVGLSQAGRGLNQSQREMRNFELGVQQAGYQLGDFAVQVQSGTSPLVAFSQQFSQLAGFFGGPWGAAVGAAAAVLSGLGLAFLNVSGNVKTLSDSLSDLESSIAAVAEATEVYSAEGIQKLTDKYGQLDSQVLQLIESQTAYANLLASKDLKDALASIQEAIGGSMFDIGISERASSLLTLQKVFQVTRNDAESLRAAFDAVAQAETYEEQAAALTTVSEYLGIVLSAQEEVTQEQLDIYNAVMQSLDAVKQLSAVQPKQSWLSAAITQAEGLATALWEAAKARAAAVPESVNMTTGDMDWAKNQLGFTLPGEELLGLPKERNSGGGGRQARLRKEIDLTKELTQAEKDRQTILKSIEGSLEAGFMSMVDGTKSVKSAFKSMAAEIIKELYRVLVVQRLVGGISGAIGMFTGKSTGSLGLPFGLATGGSMMPNQPYLVGEHGPELVIPRHSGTVVNANQTAGATGGSGTTVVNNNISVTGSDSAMVRTEIAKMIPQITNATKAAVIDAKQRGGQMAAAFR
jgi:hypothetical protein